MIKHCLAHLSCEINADRDSEKPVCGYIMIFLILATACLCYRFMLALFAFMVCFSEKAAADTSQMKELEGILREAQSLECYLKEKKNHLRQTLALISDKLQG